MSSKRYQGKIVRWKDDRGFGFIQTNGITKDIFLHISAIQGASRRPQIDDTIYFDLKKEADGKYKAVNASFIEAIPVASRKTFPKQQPSKRNSKSMSVMASWLVSGSIFIIASIIYAPKAIRYMRSCDIKGNISYPDGEKFFHKPGYRDYDKVEIFENEGERWFCSEQEAINAGFKDAANQ